MGHHREFAQCATRMHGARNGSVNAASLHQKSHESEHAVAENHIGHLLLDREDFQIRLAEPGATEESDALIYRMYTQRGYKLSSPAAALQATNEITFQACRDLTVFGTLSVRFDSDRGLGADALYQEHIDEYRNDGARVAELTRLAVDPEFGSKEVLGGLFHLAYVFCGPVRRIDDVFIEVNPRHVPFYRRMLDFTAIGECKICPRVEAPAVLMHVKVAYVGAQAAQCGGQHGVASRSLYPYFCPRWEEEAVKRRVAELTGTEHPGTPLQRGLRAQLDGMAHSAAVDQSPANEALA
jgi:hypothetical protein